MFSVTILTRVDAVQEHHKSLAQQHAELSAKLENLVSSALKKKKAILRVDAVQEHRKSLAQQFSTYFTT